MATEDFLEVDPPIGGQSYTCLSFISPEKVLADKNLQFMHKFLKTIGKNYDLDETSIVAKYQDFLYINEDKLQAEYDHVHDFKTSTRGVKVRGTYSSLKEAQMKAAKLQKTDPNFNVYIGQVGYWLPWDPRPDAIEGQEYAESELNELVKKYKENQTNKDSHFRENIEYVKDQQDKANKANKALQVNDEDESVETTDTESALGVDNTPVMNDIDPWLQRKQEAKDIVTKTLAEQLVSKTEAQALAIEVAKAAAKAASKVLGETP